MTQQTNMLLHSIWSGETKIATGDGATQVQTLVAKLFPIRSIVLSVPEGPLSGRVFADEVELLPSLPVGDVVAEEFGADVPAGTIFICCSEAALSAKCSAGARSRVLGAICAEIILDTVFLGSYRIEVEAHAFHHLSEAALRGACGLHAETGEITPAAFGLALAQRLDACLLGQGPRARTEDSHVRQMRRLLDGRALNTTILADVGGGQDVYDLETWTGAVAAALHACFPQLKPALTGSGHKANRSSV